MKQLNIDKLRKDTPGCQHVSHFNNAGASLSPELTIASIWKRIQHLALYMRQNLLDVGVQLQDLGTNQYGIITFTSSKKSVEEIQAYLAKEHINVSISLQEYARLDMSKRNIPALVRASAHYYNT